MAVLGWQVGKAFQKNKTVTIAKMDATANDVPKKFSVRLLPACACVRARAFACAHGCYVGLAGGWE